MDGAFDMPQSFGPSSQALVYTLQSIVMEEDISTAPGSPSIEEDIDLSREQVALEKQRASLKTYLSSLPYDVESEEEMHARLEFILGRITICAETKNWLVLATWDGVLQWCA
jgi:proteasome activator subunit 4